MSAMFEIRRDRARCLLALHRVRGTTDMMTAEIEMMSAKIIFFRGHVPIDNFVITALAQAHQNLDRLQGNPPAFGSLPMAA